MLANDVLVDAYGRIETEVHQVVADLSDDALAFRPVPNANSIAWLVWHIARVQDAQIAAVAGSGEVWTDDGWAEKFDLPFDAAETGYGMSSSDVAKVRASAELLTGYYDAVHARTLQYLASLQDADYQKVVDENYDPPVTLLTRLVSILNDDLQHAGQAAFVRGLLPS
jgi:uncharacterized damage-inducible protein DinB